MDKRSLWLVILILLLGTAVRFYHIQTRSIWFDEGWSAYAAAQPTLIDAWNADLTNPPLYYLTLNAAARFIGQTELALRWVSLAFGLLAAALAYRLGRHLFGDQAGIMASLLLMLSPLMWWASQEARMYTQLAALVLLCALAWHGLMRQPRQYWWLLLWLAELALLYAHNTGPVIVIWLNTAAVLFWFIRYFAHKRHHSPAIPPRTVLLWIAGQLGVVLLWLPYFITRFLNLAEANSAVSSTTPLTPDALARFWQVLWAGAWTLGGQEPLLITLSLLILALVALLIPWRKTAVRWLVLHITVLTAALWFSLSVLGNELHGRYLVMILPLLLVAIAAGISQTPLRRLLYGLLLSLLAFNLLAVVHIITTTPTYQHDDARGMARYYADQLTAQDTVLMWSYADRYEFAYYWPRLAVQANRVTLPEGADLDAVLPLLPTSGDVALNIWYTQRADYRGMLGCVLGAGTVAPPERYDVYGMTNLLFRAPALRPIALQPFAAVLPFAALDAVGTVSPAPSDQAVCLPLQLTLTQPLSVDLKASLRVLNSLGWEVARTDAIFADRIQRTSSQLGVGAALTAYPLLRLPYAAPAGTYRVLLDIYDETAQPSGYDFTLPDSAQPRRSLEIARWQALPGADWSPSPAASALPVPLNLQVDDSLTLLAHNLAGITLRNGDLLRIEMLWSGQGILPPLTLRARDGAWSTEIAPLSLTPINGVSLDWREARIPPDVPAGAAELRLPDGTSLAAITIDALPLLLFPPPYDVPVGIELSGVGSLEGYSVAGTMSDRSQPFTVTLNWRAAQPTAASLTVFVQLVSADGRVLAQSDSLPVQGSRPTTTWRSGEYIIDAHQLTFHADAFPTTATLIAGFYDASTGVRLPVSSGGDSIVIQEGIVVR
ncbi:MAG: glycosyltransferase family 39 protein [Anaerolineae bacterium]|nr:glycosyltransferase family 39 protein [Anaerolineae bacterium]